MPDVRRLDPDDRPEMQAVLALIRAEFEYMDGRIDPPTSMHRLTVDDLASGPGEVWVVGQPIEACVVLTAKPLTAKYDALYVGKLAVAGPSRGKGLARLLLDQADQRARELGLPWLELQTRIELTTNQELFTAMGFGETERTAHPGYDRATSITYRRAVR